MTKDINSANPAEGKLSTLRTRLLFLATVALFIVVGIAVASQIKTQNLSVNKSIYAYDEILNEAIPNLTPSKKELLQPTVSKIMLIKDYDKSADLLYVVVMYSIYSGDTKSAKDYLVKLESAYDSTKGYTKILANVGLSLGQIKSYIEFTDLQKDEFKRNTILMPTGEGQ